MTSKQPLHLNSFGRRRGRRLRANRSGLVEKILPRLRIALPEHGTCLEHIFPDPKRDLWFEIGFGGGEHLAEQARRNPQVNFIGCEPYVNGMASLLAMLEQERISNVRLYDGDARLVLERLPDASIARLFILFPDPWPKARHHKRRIISQEGLRLFHQKLRPGGSLRIATDHEEYGIWIHENLQQFKGFSVRTKPSESLPADWVPTRYQMKAREQNRNATFFDTMKLSKERL